MGALLDPSDAILLVLASPEATHLDAGPPRAAQIQVITRAATACVVPTFEIQFTSIRAPAAQSSASASPLPPHAIHSLDVEAPDWSATPLGLHVAKTNRTSLLVVGYWLEEAVTFVVLRALSHSYKVYVVLDATPAENSVAGDAARQRLVFAGAVPTTTHQVLREWAATTSDPRSRQALLALRTA